MDTDFIFKALTKNNDGYLKSLDDLSTHGKVFFYACFHLMVKQKDISPSKHKNTFNTFKILSENVNISVKRNETLTILSKFIDNKGCLIDEKKKRIISQINDHIWCYWDLYSHASLFIVFEELILAYFFTGSTIPRRERGVHLYCHWLRTTAPPLKDDGGRVCLPFAPTPRHPTAIRTIRASAANTAVIVTGARPAWTTLSTSWLSGST